MFRSLLWFDVKQRLLRPSSMIYFSVYFALAFLVGIAFGGVFSGVIIHFGLSQKLALNSPVALHYLISMLNYFALLIIAPIFGQSVYHDFETGFSQVLFATPIRKSTYFLLRFLSSFLSVLAILSSIGLGLWCASWMPFIEKTMVQEQHFWFYVVPYLATVIPNILFFGALFMAVVCIFKKIAPVYVASIVLFTGMMIAGAIVGDLDNLLTAALLDPFGMEAMKQIIRYWSVAEQSAQVIPLIGCFLYNRLLWGLGTCLVLALAYRSFNPFKLAKEKKTETLLPDLQPITLSRSPLFPRSWKVLWQLSLSEFRQTFSNVFFLIVLLCGVLYIFSISGHIDKIFGTQTYPVTYQVLEMVGGTFSLFIAIITVFYAGELVWKDRNQRVHELIDATPVSDLYLYLSKLLCLAFIQIFLLTVVLASCVLIQSAKGYFHYEWGLYATFLYFYTLPGWIFTCVLALLVQTISPNKYIGHGIVVTLLILTLWLPTLGLDHRLYLLGSLPHPVYSDMNGFGSILKPFAAFGLYWGFLHAALAVLTVLWWQRGNVLTLKDRFREFRNRINPAHKRVLATSLSCWMVAGCFIFYNTNILNTYTTKATATKETVDYELTYKMYEKAVMPDLIAVSMNIDLFPEAQGMDGAGVFTYKNNTDQPIKTVLLTLAEEGKVDRLEWSRSSHLQKDDRRLNVQLYDFETPLLPGEEVKMECAVSVRTEGFKNGGFSTKIVANGTFFSVENYFPVLGYRPENELSSKREKYGLPEKPNMPGLNDPEAVQKFGTHEKTWIDFEATISTSKDQIAIAPGYLVKEWEVGERRYFSYKMDQPILPMFAFLSGRYEVARDQWNDVKIEIYHHPSHTYNIDRMIEAVKQSLDYYTREFSPYQFKQLRIIEFPRYKMMAQAFPNTVPYSESIGFIARVDPNNPEDVDYPFWVTAHEVAHQWWGHQVVGAYMQGTTMLSESLAQYSSLMVMEKAVGPEKMKKFLKYALDRYLVGRSHESKKELPLMLNENQMYIHYEKGALVFYALKDYLGEETVNRVLRDYIKDVAYQKPPFTRSIDLVERFKGIAPEEFKHLIADWFETITFYDNRTHLVAFKRGGDRGYEVEIVCSNKKLKVDDQGFEQEIPMDDWVDVGIYDQEGQLAYLQKHKIKSGSNRFVVEVDFAPSKAGIDPLNKLIDKIPSDNVMPAFPKPPI